jgi:hypothetical protein
MPNKRVMMSMTPFNGILPHDDDCVVSSQGALPAGS